MLVFEGFLRGKPELPGEKPPGAEVENQQTQPTYDAESGNRTRAIFGYWLITQQKSS